MKKVIIANDHAGVSLAERLSVFLKKNGYETEWLGTKTEDSVDYPDMAEKACRKYLEGGYEFGILICGTGIGISISANKIRGIFCALVQNSFAASMAKEHNNANFIAFGARIDYPESVEDILKAYIDAEVSESERHKKRREKMALLDSIR